MATMLGRLETSYKEKGLLFRNPLNPLSPAGIFRPRPV